MNEMNLLRLLGEIDETFIEAAAPAEAQLAAVEQVAVAQDAPALTTPVVETPQANLLRPRRIRRTGTQHAASQSAKAAQKNKTIYWPRYATFAACACVLLCAVVVYQDILFGGILNTGTDTAAPLEQTQSDQIDTSTGAAPQGDTDAVPDGDDDSGVDYPTRGEIDLALLLDGYTLPSPSEPTETAADGLLILTPSLTVGGMGFEGVMLYDFAEYIGENPGWACLNFDYETLPVYLTEYAYYPDYTAQEIGYGTPPDTDAMQAQLYILAECFGIDAASAERTDDAPTASQIASMLALYDGAPADTLIQGVYLSTYQMQSGNITLSVDRYGGEEITFEAAVPLQNAYDAADYATEAERLTAIGEELIATYADYLNMQAPQVEIINLDYTNNGEQYLRIEIYEGAGEGEDALLNYHFNRVSFYLNDTDALTMIRGDAYDLSDKAGDYPIVTLEEATALLKSGSYITTVSEDLLLDGGLADSNIAGVELVYRTATFESVYLPYYRFWVEIETGNDSAAALGLKTYGAYYVPAVQSEYLSEGMLWDGSFN